MWFEEWAKKGNPSAIHNVGLEYYKGLNVKQDRAKAFTILLGLPNQHSYSPRRWLLLNYMGGWH